MLKRLESSSEVHVEVTLLMICVADGSGILVLVGQDGVQRPPLHFPRGGHLLAFLSCVETGLMPLGRLEPPLWYENGTGNCYYSSHIR